MPIFLLGVSLAGVAYIDFAIFIFLAWMILRNVMGHAGIELHPAGWVDSKWLDWLTTTTHHDRSEEHTSELQSLMRISYAVFCLKKNKNNHSKTHIYINT